MTKTNTKNKATNEGSSKIVDNTSVYLHVDSMLKELEDMDISATENLQVKSVSLEQFDKVITDVGKEYDANRIVSIAGTFCTLQAGGTSNNKRSNVKITIQGKGFESKKINSIITRHCKGITPRQFAKFFANQISNCSIKFGIMGNAYKYVKRHYPTMLTEENVNEEYWCSDFQIDNDNCPNYIRDALRKRYADKFRRGLI